MIKPSVIYGIYHKDALGYIGITTDLKRRSRRHLNPKTRKHRKVDLWLSSVGKDVDFKILEELSAGHMNSLSVEKAWRIKLNPIVMA